MALIVPDTGVGQVFNPNPVDLQINSHPALVARIKGRSHIYVDPADGVTKWYDYANGKSYVVHGQIAIGTDAGFGGKKVATFAPGAYVDMGNAWPVASDFTLVAVYRRAASANAMNIFGGPNPGGEVNPAAGGYHTLHTTSDGRLSYQHRGPAGGAGFDGAGVLPALAVNAGHVVTISWNKATGRLRAGADGGAYGGDFIGQDSNALAAMYIGHLVGFDLDFAGQVAEVIVFAADLVGDQLAPTVAFLRAEYGLA